MAHHPHRGGVLAAIAALIALIFGSTHTAIIMGVMLIPVLVFAGVLFVVERAAVRAVALQCSCE